MLSMHTSPLAQLGVGYGGGMNVYVRELSNALARRGIDVDVYTASNDGGSNLIDLRSPVRVHHIPLEYKHEPLEYKHEPLEFAAKVQEHIEGSGGVDILHAHYWLSGVAGHKLKHDLNVPLVSTFHTLQLVKAAEASEAIFAGSAGNTQPNERSDAERSVIGCSDAVVASNLIEAGDIRRLYNQDASIEIVTPGIDTAVFHPGDKVAARQALGLPLEVPIILFAGRIQHAKGLDRAVDAFERIAALHPEAILLVAGGPSGAHGQAEQQSIRKTISNADLDSRVQFLGPRSRNDIAQLMRAADICIVPSRTESFGLVALEAAACATPVVASRRGGLQYVVQHGRTGFLTQTIDDLAGAMDHLITEPERAQILGQNAAARARTFTWEHTADRMLQIYCALAGSNERISENCFTA